METRNDIYHLSAWRGEFTHPEIERGYRQHNQLTFARHLRRCLVVWLVLLLLFGLLDYPALGVSTEFAIVAGLRLATAVLLLALFFQLKSKPELATEGYAVTAIEVFGFVLFFFLYFIRHDIVSWIIGVVAMLIISLYVFVSNRVYLSTLAACFGIAGMLYSVWLNGFGAPELIGLLFMLSLPTVVGFFTALRLQTVQRQQYALFKQVSSINRNLQNEIKQREALEAELKRQATTDPLTGLLNRRQYEMLFNRERERCTRQEKHISLCVADLDYFKRINDTYGHDVGDLALRHVADLFNRTLRQSDVLGRYGGEEFVLILPDTDLDQAADVVNRLREALQASTLKIPSGEIRLTATFGLAQVAGAEKNIDSVIKRADRALYDGKAAGRNRVMTA
ncbi:MULTISPECIES: GGDEF domain-containing protein [Pseudomonas]|uniref:diguanylate cyclase n=1 Tax=Pseudomonas neustonica TaxID=2487346 RepID=A0ABX9XKF9_9PSED|nr:MULTISPECIES: GGDEF domain-containing protein [Pseudomonas]MBA6418544.1 GGDEF domain-containing protein [Pseudomonas sp. 5Ae-yellow]ROZ84993.1 GGDEF domain-containing protein [Pseudomonas sp. SSM44]ROZ86720.1 GGDEF domain-containing protein [Pseudomonas neustonica]